MSGFSVSRARSSVLSQFGRKFRFRIRPAAVGALSPISASADPMATKCHGLKLKEIFNNCLPGMAPIEIA
jgi:hypothetical protein